MHRYERESSDDQVVPPGEGEERVVLREVLRDLRQVMPVRGGAGSHSGEVDRASGVALVAVLETSIECCAPLGAPVLDDDEALATATLFQALADPARVRIVNVLATRHEPVCACELYEPLGLSQPTVSHHLKKLVEAGLLDREQRGRWAYFSLSHEAVEKLAAVTDLKGACC
jgi:ArsR family transcriptional regulator